MVEQLELRDAEVELGLEGREAEQEGAGERGMAQEGDVGRIAEDQEIASEALRLLRVRSTKANMSGGSDSSATRAVIVPWAKSSPPQPAVSVS